MRTALTNVSGIGQELNP